jgi:hypothetical protein
VSTAVLKLGRDACSVGRVPAGEVEGVVVAQLRHLLASPEIIVRTWRAARQQESTITESEVRTALIDLEPLWEELFPVEQARIVHLLVDRIDVAESGIALTLRAEGLTSLIQDLRGADAGMQRAA